MTETIKEIIVIGFLLLILVFLIWFKIKYLKDDDTDLHH